MRLISLLRSVLTGVRPAEPERTIQSITAPMKSILEELRSFQADRHAKSEALVAQAEDILKASNVAKVDAKNAAGLIAQYEKLTAA